jgi:imidazolonepropionase-like amidohydrolase
MKRLWFVLIGLASLASAQEVWAVKGAAVVDGTGAPARAATVVVRDGRIEAVLEEGAAAPQGARVIDARGKTLLPGLFDLHTHLLANAAGGGEADWGKNLKAYLVSGVTTVADMSTYPEQFEPMRRLIRGGLPAPRVLMAGRYSTPGGHGAEGGRGDFHTQLVLTPRAARAAVRRFAAYRPDVLKVFTDGWRYGTDTDMTSMDEETLSALVDEAHKAGLKVVTHTVTVEKGKIAARAGVDIILHGLGDAPADEEWISLMKRRGAGYVQTLAVYEPRQGREVAREFLAQVLEPPLLARLRAPAAGAGDEARARRWRNLLANCRLARDGGVLLGAGTDAGMTGTYHGWASLRELELMVRGGLTPLEAITAATGASAKLLGVEADRGTIAPGKAADLVLIDGAPHERIGDLYRVSRVWLGGVEIDRKALTAAIARQGPTPVAAIPAVELLDDFESADGRSRCGTLWINNTDGGHDHAEMAYARTSREPGGHALTVLARMTEKDRPYASMVLPLSKGAVEPVDARAFAGVEFEARGEGAYSLAIHTRSRGRAYFRARFEARPAWGKIRIPFTALEHAEAWGGGDLTALAFMIERPAGEQAWLEIDNVRFFRR